MCDVGLDLHAIGVSLTEAALDYAPLFIFEPRRA
jgi:hypothetical protein